MRVLWISPTEGYYSGNEMVGSGGWIRSLQLEIIKNCNIDLGFTFVHNTDSTKTVKNNTTYYPIKSINPQSKIAKFFDRYLGNTLEKEEYYINRILEVIENFKPDIIHIWGLEHFYIKILGRTNIPCIVHIQGIASTCINAYFPPGISVEDIKREDGFINRCILKRGLYYCYKQLYRIAAIEKEVFPKVKFIMGRTEWDKGIVSLLMPNAKYFHCDEIMRDTFDQLKWKYNDRNEIVIHSSLGDVSYKGLDIILKTANVLKELNVNFRWNVCGIGNDSKMINLILKKNRISDITTNVNFLGLVSPTRLAELLVSSDMYVHSSYIESGSNAISEAQLVGVPVIANYVGGLPTTLKNDSGIIVQANDPYTLAKQILNLKNKKTAEYYSNNALLEATKRHNKTSITNDLIKIYQDAVDAV